MREVKKQSEMIKDRLKNVMITDRVSNIENLLTILKSDLYSLCSNYMYMKPENLHVVLDADSEGGYEFTFKVFTDHLIDAGKMID